jgi:3'(2'), 5'-bisphosphate nucleotidase
MLTRKVDNHVPSQDDTAPTTASGPPTASGALPEDHVKAVAIAEQAGELLLELRAELVASGADSTTLKDLGDARSHDLIMSALAGALAAGDAVLSEEGKDDHVRLAADRVWIVDPLDGTREFSEPPRSDWAVHVALVIGGAPVAGAVALPALGLTLGTNPAPAAPPPMTGPPRVIVSRTRPPAAATWLAEKIEGQLVEMGSAGAKAMAVVRGEADVYAHSGGQYEWDSCAPVAVALAAGLHATRLDGSPLVYNNADPYLPDLLICRRELAEVSLAALRDFEG